MTKKKMTNINKQYYLGVKLIEAIPMTKGEAYKNGFFKTCFADGEENQEGYTVFYPDGYTSWSPKNVFENSYFRIIHNDKISETDVSNFIRNVVHKRIGETNTAVTLHTTTNFEITEMFKHVSKSEYDYLYGVKKAYAKANDTLRHYLTFVLQWALKDVLNNTKY